VALVLLYYVATVMLRKLGHGSILTPALAAWLPNGVFLLLGGYWFFRRANF
jgi:lipopolysaccharide export system permease protein